MSQIALAGWKEERQPFSIRGEISSSFCGEINKFAAQLLVDWSIASMYEASEILAGQGLGGHHSPRR